MNPQVSPRPYGRIWGKGRKQECVGKALLVAIPTHTGPKGLPRWCSKTQATLWSSPHANKNPPANAGDTEDAGFIPGLGRSPGRGNGNPPHFCCLENPRDREAWRAAVHGVAKESSLTEHALKGPSLSLAGSSGFLARVCCPSPWLSRTTWDISISLNTTQTCDICESYFFHFPSSSSGPKPDSRALILWQSTEEAHTAFRRTPQGCLYLPTMVGLQTTLTFLFIPFYFPKHRE